VGNFEYAYFQFQNPSQQILRYGKSTIFAHNGWLQTAAEAGLPALIFLFAGFVSILSDLRKSNDGLGFDRWALSVGIVFFVSGLFNYSLFLPFNGLVFALAVGVMLGHVKRNGETLLASKPIFISVATVLSLLIGGIAASNAYASSGNYAHAARLMPLNGELWYKKALQTLQDGNFLSPEKEPKVLADLNRAVRCEPRNAFYWSRLARVLMQSGTARPEDSLRALDNALRFAPFHAPFWIQRGYFLLSMEHPADAIPDFEKAAALEPNAPAPFFLLGLAKLKTGEKNQGLEFVKRAKQLKDDEPHAKSLSGYNNELISSDYGTFLFSVDTSLIDKILKKENERTSKS
jgi:tetratricopeptide (TPR) repeat protein